MLFLIGISERKPLLDMILKDWLNNLKIEFVEDLDKPITSMKENYLLLELYDMDIDEDVLIKTSIKDALKIVLKKYNIEWLELLMVEEDYISRIYNIKINTKE